MCLIYSEKVYPYIRLRTAQSGREIWSAVSLKIQLTRFLCLIQLTRFLCLSATLSGAEQYPSFRVHSDSAIINPFPSLVSLKDTRISAP